MHTNADAVAANVDAIVPPELAATIVSPKS